jgi:NAD(P)-dependent dehydrogenase (short-subunit alcohol dehydrogenase family)
VALAERGSDVALVARQIDGQAQDLKRRIEAMGRRCELIGADMGKPDDARRCVQQAAEAFGGIDVLVHSAGGPVPGGLFDVRPEAWYAAFDVHVHAVFHLCRAAIPLMRAKRQGAIVLISSTAGIRAIKTNITYQAVKGAIPHLARALAFEFADDNIRVNCVAPGIIRTDFHAAMTEQQKKHNLDNRVPLHREGTPQQVASVIREMIANDYVTGETYVIDGGLTMRIC